MKDDIDMSMENLSNIGPDNLSDPNLDPWTLARLAETRSDLWPAIQQHPNCYPELQHWISQQLGQQHYQPPAPSGQQQPQAPPRLTPDQWAAEFQQNSGREPTMSEFRDAQMRGEVGRERTAVDPSMQQMTQGAKQLAGGAKDFFTNRVAPTAVGAARNVQTSVREQAGQARSGGGWQAWMPLALPASAVLSVIGLCLPAASASASGFGYSFSDSQSYFNEDAGGIGWVLLIFVLITLAFAVTAMVKRVKWSRITAGVAGIVTAIFAAISSFGIMGAVSDYSGSGFGVSASASVGPGAVILAIASVCMLAAAVLTLVMLRGHKAPRLQ
ncbi:MAG: hypothetical protein ACTMKZ_15975 [Brevibacterium aurantiacum]|uniref:variant leucine-rich repeat-containing protein n=1 Tax=Brevibacterium aurantiacum TaxID=273384 RepID=UPI0011C031FC|nr:hypothetical protein [Brevibacterium aurantiacum]